MTPGAFIAKWRASELKERSAAQEHFIDLCRLLGQPTPAEADPTGESYCFERRARKDSGGAHGSPAWRRTVGGQDSTEGATVKTEGYPGRAFGACGLGRRVRLSPNAADAAHLGALRR